MIYIYIMTIKYDIAIIGAGLTGITTSIALAKAGYKIALIDPKSFVDFKKNIHDTRTTALSKKAKVFYENLGLWKLIEPHACMIKKILVNDGDKNQNIFFEKKKN